tara:strand:- start:5765 stop:5995 length:231 start_codon:yes stop_codon:yes gene_type:complete
MIFGSGRPRDRGFREELQAKSLIVAERRSGVTLNTRLYVGGGSRHLARRLARHQLVVEVVGLGLAVARKLGRWGLI